MLGLGFENRMNDTYQVWSPQLIYRGPSAAPETSVGVHIFAFSRPRIVANFVTNFVLQVPAKLLLSRITGAHSDIHPADLADLLARSGIDLVAERIESENMVVDLLDYDVRFGQGFLFSPPRPVRAEALQGSASGSAKPGEAENEGPGALLAAG